MGAWIETFIILIPSLHESVAPYVGAWIETRCAGRQTKNRNVAPYVGAWIETWSWNDNESRIRSHPTWVRGLKPNEVEAMYVKMRGRTLRGCVD